MPWHLRGYCGIFARLCGRQGCGAQRAIGSKKPLSVPEFFDLALLIATYRQHRFFRDLMGQKIISDPSANIFIGIGYL
jgi:hypothetical protein